jgi:hypothetical protein
MAFSATTMDWWQREKTWKNSNFLTRKYHHKLVDSIPWMIPFLCHWIAMAAKKKVWWHQVWQWHLWILPSRTQRNNHFFRENHRSGGFPTSDYQILPDAKSHWITIKHIKSL